MPDTGLKKRDIRSLTGIRGVAALWVAIYHFGLQHTWFIPYQHAGFLALIAHGYLAVDLFFVLSGFVMAVSYGHFFETFSPSKFMIFLIRRFARIYPLFAFVLLVALVSNQTRYTSHYSLLVILSNMFLVQSWGICLSIVSQSWSVSTELMAYLLFPALFYVACLRGNASATMVFVLSVTGLGVTALAVVPDGDTRFGMLDIIFPGSLYPVLRCLCGFCLGLLSYRLSTRSALADIRDSKGLSLLVLSLLLFCLTQKNLDIFDVIISFFLVFLLSGTNSAANLMSIRPFLFLGEISYAVYFVHVWLLNPIHSLFQSMSVTPRITEFCVYLVMIVILSWVLHLFIEKPSRIYLRKAENVFNRQAEALVAKSEATETREP